MPRKRMSRVAKSARQMIRELASLRNQFTDDTASAKESLLSILSRTPIDSAGELFDYHEALLFTRTYPDNHSILRLAGSECDSFAGRINRLRKRDREEALELDDTGITSTRMFYSYDYDAVIWLVRWFGDQLDINWEELDNSEKLDSFLPLIVEWCENDGLDLADMTTEEWVALHTGDGAGSALCWIIERLDRMKAPHTVKRLLYDSMDLPVVWKMGDSPAARTHGRIGRAKPHFHHEPLLRKLPAFSDEIRKSLPPIEPASPGTARSLIKTLRCALAVRHRSLYPIEYAAPDDVLVAECGRGYTLVLYGMDPQYRLALESDYAALIVKNGFVIGYGVGAILFDQVEIAVNIFETWRGGEAAYIFAQYIRMFHNQFGCTRFKIERYQVGYENDEGLQSGSFWFYYNLGFVPSDPKVLALARREAAKIRKNRAYRTPIATLEKLAVSDLYLTIGKESRAAAADFPLADLSLAATRTIGEDFDGEAALAIEECAAKVAAALGCPGWKNWPRRERDWFERLSLIFARIPKLDSWKPAEKRGLVELIRAKGGVGETRFVQLSRRNLKFQKALERVARKIN